MPETSLIGPWIRRFLHEHMIGERNLSRNTQMSYRDTLVLLLPFAAETTNRRVDKLTVDDVSPEVVRLFLGHLEEQRGCSVATRNQRLAAIHALARFIASGPEHIAWCSQIRAVPFKKTAKPSIGYLEKPEMDAILDAPNRATRQGDRDYAALLFLYNTGTRADEAAHVTVADLDLGRSPWVKIFGKGNKTRRCPLWTLTAATLAPLIKDRLPHERVFLNRRKEPITRFGIHALVKRYATRASRQLPSLGAKEISPHTLRHTTAVHLLRAGVDLNTIRAWLGHVSLDTTNVYAEIDLQMKANALAHCEIFAPAVANTRKNWHDNPDVMDFLRSL